MSGPRYEWSFAIYMATGVAGMIGILAACILAGPWSLLAALSIPGAHWVGHLRGQTKVYREWAGESRRTLGMIDGETA